MVRVPCRQAISLWSLVRRCLNPFLFIVLAGLLSPSHGQLVEVVAVTARNIPLFPVLWYAPNSATPRRTYKNSTTPAFHHSHSPLPFHGRAWSRLFRQKASRPLPPALGKFLPRLDRHSPSWLTNSWNNNAVLSCNCFGAPPSLQRTLTRPHPPRRRRPAPPRVSGDQSGGPILWSHPSILNAHRTQRLPQ